MSSEVVTSHTIREQSEDGAPSSSASRQADVAVADLSVQEVPGRPRPRGARSPEFNAARTWYSLPIYCKKLIW